MREEEEGKEAAKEEDYNNFSSVNRDYGFWTIVQMPVICFSDYASLLLRTYTYTVIHI